MNITIKKTNKENYFITENLTREAFWNLYKPGCDEHLVLHNLRISSSYIAELDVIAVYKQQTIGLIISTTAKVVDSQNKEYQILCVGPLSVLPEYQKKGIGSKLIIHSIEEAKKMNYNGMILFGNPDYYHRFGFKNAKEYGITTKDNKNFEPFMALELKENGLKNVSGKFFEDEAFITKEKELIEFEIKFPLKKKGKPKVEINL
jgi:predicted N-acetyltransferase YhbS